VFAWGLKTVSPAELCRKAPNAARRAKKLGHANVKVMSAGISGWLSARLPVSSGE
jgi:3-mercaptopyruvate sulfurtransferase SseA